MRFYRFELEFEGEPQEVGFLDGLEDTSLPINRMRYCYELFEQLPSPDLPPEGRYMFWFTEEGLAAYAQSIHTVNRILKTDAPGWELIAAVMTISNNFLRRAVYTDHWQAAWLRMDMPGELPLRTYHNIAKLKRSIAYQPEKIMKEKQIREMEVMA